MFLVWISQSKSVKKLQKKQKKKSKCKIQDFQYQNPNLDLGNINLKTKDEPSYTTSSAWKSSALLLILNHFLTRDLGHESFTNIIKSQQISKITMQTSKVNERHSSFGFANNQPCYSWNTHLSFFPQLYIEMSDIETCDFASDY